MRAIVISALLSLNLQASFADGLPLGAPHDHSDQAESQLVVFDAQGKFVGSFSDYGGPGVYLTVNGAIAFVPMERLIVSGDGGPQTIYSGTDFRWSGTNALDFGSSDCSGAPVITTSIGVRPSVTARQGAEVTLYIAGETNSGPMRVASTRSGPNFACVPNAIPSIEYGWPTETTYSVTGAYPEPLTIRYPRDGSYQRWR